MRARNGYRGLHEWLSDTRVVQLPWPGRRRVLTGQPREWTLLHPDGLPAALGPFVIRGALRWDPRGRVLLGEDRGLGRSVWIWLHPATESPLSEARRSIGRPTRLRWLACGRDADWQWDAFMAFHGSPLPRPSRRREETWPRALPLLEQLTDELVTAATEETLPDTLHRDQVWVGPDGQLQLLDIPLSGMDDPGHSGPDRARRLLADVAAHTLEDPARIAGRPGRVQAPVPLRVRPSLDRLLGMGTPYRDVSEFQSELKALRDQPAEVAAARRGTHLVVLGALSSVGLALMLLAGWLNQITPFTLLVGIIQTKEQRLHDLERGACFECALGSINPDPLVRLQAAVQLDADYQLLDRLRDSRDRVRHHYAARLESVGTLTRRTIERMREQAEVQREVNERMQARTPPTFEEIQRARLQATGGFQDFDSEWRLMMEGVAVFWLVILMGWPTLWVAWAFLTRGGISYRLAGIALVRRDGRPASRLQCAWRAFLVWAPLTALLVLSFWLEHRYWGLWEQGDAPRRLLHLSTAIWYKALLLLACYVILALWRPARTLHDRLSGVYLVPR
jgi:hypothetical protein